ncbi:MAG: hypothetical protein ACYC1P_08215 [Gaiellaceae bacterium]
MRRLVGKFTFFPVVLILAGFVVFTVAIAKPLKKAERRGLVVGTVTPADALRDDGPFRPYVALHRGAPGAEIPEFPLDDRQPLDDGKFELSADQTDGTRYFVLARIETATLERWCETVALPPMRQLEDRSWVEAATGKPLAPVRISVDDSTRCD